MVWKEANGPTKLVASLRLDLEPRWATLDPQPFLGAGFVSAAGIYPVHKLVRYNALQLM